MRIEFKNFNKRLLLQIYCINFPYISHYGLNNSSMYPICDYTSILNFFFRVKFEHETTDQGWRDLRDKWYFKKCYEQKNRQEWRGRTSSAGKLPATEACYATAWDAANARHYHWELDFVKV